MNLTIKQIPSKLYNHLEATAAKHGRSLNAEVIQILSGQILSADLAEAPRRERMRNTRKELEAFVARLPKTTRSVQLLREDRER